MTQSESRLSLVEKLRVLRNTNSLTGEGLEKLERLEKAIGSMDSQSRKNKVCAICGKPKGGRGLTCRNCYMQLRKLPIRLKCANCKKYFLKPLQDYNKALKNNTGEKMYCSRECANEAQRKHCVVCGKPLKHGRKYCSQICRAKAEQRRKLPDIVCPMCGETFRPISHLTKYCSKECANKAHSLRMTGKGNSDYKDGKSYAKRFKTLRKVVFKRDGYKCCICGKEQKITTVIWKGQEVSRTNLVCHHIDEDVTNNVLPNMITLCKTCHQHVHKDTKIELPDLKEIAKMNTLSMTFK